MTINENVLASLPLEHFPDVLRELSPLLLPDADDELAQIEEDMADGRRIYREAFLAGLRPEPQLRVSEWADAHRILPGRGAAEPGPWRTARTPYLREIMDRLSPSDPAEVVVFMKGAQVGGTESGNNWLGFIMDHAPGPALMVEPTVEMAKRLSRQRIAPMIEDCPRLRGKVRDPRSRDSGNTIQQKEFPGGILVITGANSAVGLRSMPARYLFLDEVDGYEQDVDGEGNPIDLALKRTVTFRRSRKVFIVSTPTVKDMSNIERAFKRSDQRYYHVPCPACGNLAPIHWENLKKVSTHPDPIDWEPSDPDEMGLLCGACGVLIPEHRKTELLANGRWVPSAEGEPGVVGYHLSSLYSPLGWYSWTDALRDLREAKAAGPEKLKTWTNTTLGEVWEESGETIDSTGLLARREHYGAEVPEPVLLLTAGCDVQDDRLEVEVVGWRTHEESWSIDYRVLWGDPDGRGPWEQLDQLLTSSWRHASGARLRILRLCVDCAGHRTKAAYRFVKSRQALGVVGTIGRAGMGRPIISPPTRRKQGAERIPIKLFTVGVDEAKSLLYARLKSQEPGPGYCHFPLREPYSEAYFLQLTAEKRIPKYEKGYLKYVWHQIRARNEALDCRVLAHAALVHLNPRWAAFERQVRDQGKHARGDADPTAEGADESAARPAKPPPKTAKRRPRRSGGWVNRWRR